MLANPTLHRVLTTPFFYLFLVAMVVPFLLWAGIAGAARRRREVLRRIYPRLKVLIGRLAFLGLVCVVLLPHHEFMTLVGQISILNLFLAGMNLLRMWIGRRVDPASYKKYEGWWPTPKDSAESAPVKNL
ncbi:MAG TPA: hypothetical protein VHA06_21345 [Candidatus Angelobacter sp.]|nr:hypothetical protein [Candidatus Angelobacter sp.]